MGNEAIMSGRADGLVIVAKRDCPTCTLIVPVYGQLADSGLGLTVISQDDPAFPNDVAGVVDDRELAQSWRLNIETVPTLLRFRGGEEIGRAVGWHRADWEALTGLSGLGPELPDARPGCGSRSVEPGMAAANRRRDARGSARGLS